MRLRSFVLLTAAAGIAAANDGNTFQWTGKIAPGQLIEIKGVNGSIRAELTEGRDVEVDSYVRAAREQNLSDAFVSPIEAHANINKNSAHGLLTRELFESIDVVSSADCARILRQTPLFIALYDDFYAAIWQHYGHEQNLLRLLADI